MRKRRVLLVNEFSRLASGYSVYGDNLLKGLHACGDYEVAELACCLQEGDPRADLPWRVYPNVPNTEAGLAEYNASVGNQFGEYSFNRVCLDFRPDVVLDIRDPWMYAFIERSPFRDCFHWIQMPTVDSAPQKEQWIATLAGCDRVLTYTDWSREVLLKEGGGLIEVFGTAPSGADFANFRLHDQGRARRRLGMEHDANIVGTVMRNQARKLYPQLIRDFASFLREAESYTASKSYLYLHTSYPDQGWDLPDLIKQSGISHRILLTYKCRDCLMIFPSFYADAATICPNCKSRFCTLPNVTSGVDRATLSMLMATFDVYVQYASCEGLGMPQIEAAASGVPVMSVDYSAMSSVVRLLGGHPIKVAAMEKDPDLGMERARPDGKDFVKALKRFFRLSSREMQDRRRQAREAVERHFTWERAVGVWKSAIDGLPLRDHAETWDKPARIHTPRPIQVEGRTNTQIVRDAIREVLGRPELANGYLALRMTRDLNWGMRMGGGGRSYQNEESMLGMANQMKSYGVQDMLDEMRAICNLNNHWERMRTS
jgi:glycosyltransferase involved in cell wall biosynthesis